LPIFEKRNMSKPKLFVSYSRKDVKYLEKFKVQIAALKRKGIIEDWNDQEIIGGDVWENTLKHQLEIADIIVFLVSADFIASDYIYDVEIKKAIERHRKGEVIVVPIIIRPCDFASLEISKFQALPKNAQSIFKWVDEDEAWLDVLLGIKKIFEGFKKNAPNTKKTESKAETVTNGSGSLKMKLAAGNLEEVNHQLLQITKAKDKDLHNSMIMQSSKYNRSKKEYTNDLLTVDQFKRSTAQIENALLAVVDELDLE